MKSILVGGKVVKNSKPFPKAMIAEDGLVVFFRESERGTCIVTGKKHDIRLAEINNGWVMRHFSDMKSCTVKFNVEDDDDTVR